LEDIKVRELEFPLVGDSLVELKREFCEEDDELAKVAKLRKVKQGIRTIEKFV